MSSVLRTGGPLIMVLLPLLTFLKTSALIHLQKTSMVICGGANMWACRSGHCIDFFLLCNGELNCPDGSDETAELCQDSVCPLKAFRCKYGGCIEENRLCDWIFDCPDGTDEKNCFSSQYPQKKPSTLCSADMWACRSGQCIDDGLLCDGEINCRDSSDESAELCKSIVCPSSSFKCNYGACVEISAKCDGIAHCQDRSDENNDSCSEELIGMPAVVETFMTAKTIRATHITTPAAPSITHVSVTSQITTKTTRPSDCKIPSPTEGTSGYVFGCSTDFSGECNSTPGSLTPTKSILNYTCASNYRFRDGVSTYTIIICINGTWQPTPEPCLRMCKGLAASNVNYVCFFNGEEISCEEMLPHGTRLRWKCNNHYIPVNPKEEQMIKCVHGNWTGDILCKPICGMKQSPNPQERTSEYAWHAALYSFIAKTQHFGYICGGTILSPFAVITAAYCVFDGDKRRKNNSFIVAVGKNTLSWNVSDPGQQILKVKNTFYKSDYQGLASKHQFDIAVLEVETMELTHTVMPVCLDKSKVFLTKNDVGVILGFDLSESSSNSSVNEILRVGKLSIIDLESCKDLSPSNSKEFITSDKLCSRPSKDFRDNLSINSGSGFSFPNEGFYYIRGISTFKIRSISSNTSTEIGVYTNVTKYYDYIEEVLGCIEQRHDDSTSTCNCSRSSSRCNHGTCVEGKLNCDSFNNCYDGLDEMGDKCVGENFIDQHAVTESPDTTNSLALTESTSSLPSKMDQFLNKPGDCLIPQQKEGSHHHVLGCTSDWSRACLGKPGTLTPTKTILSFTCLSNYRRSDGTTMSAIAICINGTWRPAPEPCYKMCPPLVRSGVTYLCSFNGDNISCEGMVPHGTRARRKCKTQYKLASVTECSHGNWTGPHFRCAPLCGIKRPAVKWDINVTRTMEYPWHASVYAIDLTSGTLRFTCGGTIISPFAILTVAHCVFKGDNKKEDSFFVTVGKTSLSWDIVDPYQQIYNVKNVFYKIEYRGQDSYYIHDIALLEVNEISLNTFVMPVCLDQSKLLPQNGAPGVVLGFELSSASPNSSVEVLRACKLTFLDWKSCVDLSSKNLFVTKDKICSIPGEDFNSQDNLAANSGSGFSFLDEDSKLYYIRGITTFRIKPQLNKNSAAITVYTNVATYIEYIQEVLECINRRLEDSTRPCKV